MSVRLAYIGNIWPEPESSAAGVRTIGLLKTFLSAGWKVSFLGPRPGRLSGFSVEEIPSFEVEPNDPGFDRLIGELSPDVVLFDRFHIEERFGWRVETVCPRALRVSRHCGFARLRSIESMRRRPLTRLAFASSPRFFVPTWPW